MFQSIGNVTGINWRDDYYAYLEYFETGLAKNKRSVRALFKEWDKKLFPNRPSKLGSKRGQSSKGARQKEVRKVMSVLNEDEEAVSSASDEA